MEIEELQNKLNKAWCAETSYYHEAWNSSNPAYGQCAVTALIVNDILGGEIVWAEVDLLDGKYESHYFNLVDGEEIDLTKEQFSNGIVVPKGLPKTKGYLSTREFMLSNENTERRYELLKQLFNKSL